MFPQRGSLRPFSLIALIAAAVLTALLAFHQSPSHAPEAAGSGARPSQAPSGWGPSVGFANYGRWQEHFEKHGEEFGAISAEEYLRRAQALRDAPAGGPILEFRRGDGVLTRFDRRSGAFIAVSRNGTIRTFFRPNDGERYFERQKQRTE